MSKIPFSVRVEEHNVVFLRHLSDATGKSIQSLIDLALERLIEDVETRGQSALFQVDPKENEKIKNIVRKHRREES